MHYSTLYCSLQFDHLPKSLTVCQSPGQTAPIMINGNFYRFGLGLEKCRARWTRQ